MQEHSCFLLRVINAKKAYAVVATGEAKIYANVIIKKGVIK
jgi:L-fucose mutarotase/ribose pyranase (RbsD/FucU family)